MICPKCGSNNVITQSVTETKTTEHIKGFGCVKACLGFLLFNLPGILCGLCGMGKGRTTTRSLTKETHVCQDCGKVF